jgi:hypothetical protein
MASIGDVVCAAPGEVVVDPDPVGVAELSVGALGVSVGVVLVVVVVESEAEGAPPLPVDPHAARTKATRAVLTVVTT